VAPQSREITVYAAASLTEAFRELAPLLQRSAAVRVRYSFAGSQQLALQLEQGARADVFAAADRRWMEYLVERGLTDGSATIFADLARPGVKLVVGAEAVPVGRYTREVLGRLARRPGFPAHYEERVLANVVSEEENVKAVVAKVRLGEADAGFVYRSDVSSRGGGDLTVLEIPEEANVTAGYPVAVLAGSREPAAARAFVDLLLGAEGARVLERHGLTPAHTP
jgi:molybdate transport system substrate-binding protein